MSNLKIENPAQLPPIQSGKIKQKGVTEFGTLFKGALGKVNTLEREANKSIVELLQGKGEVHESMIALQKADTSMKLLLTIRNKVIEAYREVMRMQF